jgi:hypothetical protein
MTEENEEAGVGMFAGSKFMRTVLVVVTVALIFAGPTYLVYLMSQVLKVEYFASVATGFVVFLVGVALMYLLFRNKVIT